MTLPAYVLVGTVLYSVTNDAQAWLEHEHEVQSKGDLGYTSHMDARILINPGNSPENTRLTLWHEILHALNYSVMGDMEWQRLIGATDSEAEAEERMVRALEHPTLAVLRDNPDLVRYLIEEE